MFKINKTWIKIQLLKNKRQFLQVILQNVVQLRHYMLANKIIGMLTKLKAKLFCSLISFHCLSI